MEKEFIKYSYILFLKKNKKHKDYLKYINLNIIEKPWPILNDHIDINNLLKIYNMLKKHILNDKVDAKMNSIIEWGDNYITSKCLEQYSAFYKFFIVNNISNFENSIGMDFGSGLGFSTINYSLYNPKKIYAVDFRDNDTFNFYINYCKLYIDNKTIIEYLRNDVNNKIFNENINELDWIIAYDVLCCIPRKYNDNYHSSLCNYLIYFYKILKTNGILFIGDWEQSNSKYKLSKNMPNFDNNSLQSYDNIYNSGMISSPNYHHVSLQSEMCKILEIIGFKNIVLYHYGYETNQRYYILCNK
jgi:hypothetical protein